MGETGSGKTTQMTQYLAEAGYIKVCGVRSYQPLCVSVVCLFFLFVLCAGVSLCCVSVLYVCAVCLCLCCVSVLWCCVLYCVPVVCVCF